MTDRELRTLAGYIAQELLARQQKDEGFIYMDEICRLTGLKRNTIYHYDKIGIPVQRRGGRLCGVKAEIVEWMKSR